MRNGAKPQRFSDLNDIVTINITLIWNRSGKLMNIVNEYYVYHILSILNFITTCNIVK